MTQQPQNSPGNETEESFKQKGKPKTAHTYQVPNLYHPKTMKVSFCVALGWSSEKMALVLHSAGVLVSTLHQLHDLVQLAHFSEPPVPHLCNEQECADKVSCCCKPACTQEGLRMCSLTLCSFFPKIAPRGQNQSISNAQLPQQDDSTLFPKERTQFPKRALD